MFLLYVSNVLIVRLTGSLSLTIVVFDDGALRESNLVNVLTGDGFVLQHG